MGGGEGRVLMYAITLWPEWAWAICRLGKRVENRTWTPQPRIQIGDRFAIHAGKHLGGRPGATARGEALQSVAHMARLAFPDADTGFTARDLLACTTSAIVCTAVLDAVDTVGRTAWDVPRSWHWRLRDVVVLDTPIAMGGRQGLWRVPADVLPRLVA